jgi:hypothetical protein
MSRGCSFSVNMSGMKNDNIWGTVTMKFQGKLSPLKGCHSPWEHITEEF